uniref:Thioredoxin n=1 Tax=Ignisphaera aggregans TaxID=334771 RepID=A0A7C5YTY1_9CREN
MINDKYKDNEINSDISEIIDRISQEYSRNIGLKSNTCCNTSLKGALYVRSYREFINALESCRITFVLITTTYCPYCRLFKPIFYRIAEQYNNKAAFIEVNADYIPEIAMMFNVYSTPTTIVLVDGRIVDELIGYIPANYFKEYIDDVLKNVKCIQG